VVLVRTEPEQAVPASHARLADDDEVDDGPLSFCPATGRPVFGSIATKSGALEAAELVSPEQPPPVTVHSLVAEVPRACGDTPVSRALVDEVAVPPHSVAAPEHSTDADARDTLAGPDTAATVPAASAGSRSATVVSADVVQLPPAPRAEQDEVPVLSRTPLTSPEAPPVVLLEPEPAHVAAAQSTWDPAVLDADSSRVAGAFRAAASWSDDAGAAALSLTCELDSTPHPPARASHFEEAPVFRTGAVPPFAAGAPVIMPVVALLALPLHAAVSQSTFAPAELVATASPSVNDAGRTASWPSRLTQESACSSTGLSTSVLLLALQALPADLQDARPVLLRSAPSRTPLAVPAVLVVPVPLHPAAHSTSTPASLLALLPRDPPLSPMSAREPLCTAHEPPARAQVAFPFVVDASEPCAAHFGAAAVVLSLPVFLVPAV
jgi:hypothetical protein